VRKADNLPPSRAVVTKSGKLNFLEPFGPVQALNGTALLLPLSFTLSIRQLNLLAEGANHHSNFFLLLSIAFCFGIVG